MLRLVSSAIGQSAMNGANDILFVISGGIIWQGIENKLWAAPKAMVLRTF
jgi:hypothetical protein